MSLHIPSPLRVQRRLWGISQKELARLLGFKSPTLLSKVEHGHRKPTMQAIVGTYVLFGVDTRNMFPRLWRELEEAVIRRVYDLYQRVENGTTRRLQRKKELAQQALARATGNASRKGSDCDHV